MIAGAKITHSSELMKNFMQSTVVSPQHKFESLQTDDGHALFFSIGTDNKFYLIEQQTGHETGWEQLDLGHKLNQQHSNFTAKTFAVAQNLTTHKIDIALAITAGGQDYLYVSTQNGSTNGAITPENIQWKFVPYDNPDDSPSQVSIEDIYISEFTDVELIVVDVKIAGGHAVKRRRIDLTKSNDDSVYWDYLELGGDFSQIANSCLGKKQHHPGNNYMFTLGDISGDQQLNMVHIHEDFTPTRLTPPQGASAMDSVGVGTNHYTDLFVAGEKNLYYYANANLTNDNPGVKVLDSDLFSGVTKLVANITDTDYVVWGLNAAKNIFYTRCPIQSVSDPTKWSHPIQLMAKVEHVSPYVNRVDNANIFFAATENELTKAVQSPKTTLWNYQQIHLKPPNPSPQDTKAFTSYTTRIQVKYTQDFPSADKLAPTLYLKASTRIPVYVNHIYYILGTQPVAIKTDNSLSLTIVELANNLNGTRLYVSDSETGTYEEINPMDSPFKKLHNLTSTSGLQSAEITNPDGSTKKLIQHSQQHLDTVAKAMGNLNSIYVQKSGNPQMRGEQSVGSTRDLGSGEGVTALIGDLFSWLESLVEEVVEFAVEVVKDAASGVWRFMVTIAGEVYHAVIDTIDAVAGAIKWVFHAIEVAIEDLVKFFEFIFAWADIKRTQQVMKNLAKVFMEHLAGDISNIKSAFDSNIGQLISDMDDWAGLAHHDWSSLGDAVTSKPNHKANHDHGLTASNSVLAHHANHQMGKIKHRSTPPNPDPGSGLVNTLISHLEAEGHILEHAINEFQNLVSDINTLTVEQIIKRIIGIIAESLMTSVKNIVDALFDIFIAIANEAVAILETKIYIPVVSEILQYFGITIDLTYLDLFCYVVAIPFTAIYKAIANKAPFPDNALTNFLSTSGSFTNFISAFGAQQIGQGHVQQHRVNLQGSTLPNITEVEKQTFFAKMIISSSVFNALGGVIKSLEALEERGNNPLSKPKSIMTILNLATFGSAIYLVPHNSIQSETYRILKYIMLSSYGLNKLLGSSIAKKIVNTPRLKGKNLDPRGAVACVDISIIFLGVVCTIHHFKELGNNPSSKDNTVAIIGEISSCTNYVSRFCYDFAVAFGLKNYMVPGLLISSLVTSGLRTAEGIVAVAP